MLDALGLKTTDLERAQESFSMLWQKYDFRVKTFQEGLGLTGFNLGILGKKVVPSYSSLLGDHREEAETMQANHMEMCRFTGLEDPNYRKVAGELRSIYRHLKFIESALKDSQSDCVDLNTRDQTTTPTVEPPSPLGDIDSANLKAYEFTTAEKAFLHSLWYPSINDRRYAIERPAEKTCSWLFQHKSYLDWLNDRDRDTHHGLLWLKGHPGTGKSVIMKEAFRRAALSEADTGYCATFFFNAKGNQLEQSPTGVFLSLLYQLLPKYRGYLQSLSARWENETILTPNGADKEGKSLLQSWTSAELGALLQSWTSAELEALFESLVQKSTKRTLIFVDALDECDQPESQAYFWRRITKWAHDKGIPLSVCLSSRHFPTIAIADCLEIVLESHNNQGIASYVTQRFQLAAAKPKWEPLRNKILQRSAGVFLWAVLVVDDVLRKWNEGRSTIFLLKEIDTVPKALGNLFSRILSSLRPEERPLTVRLFQWAIYAVRPLRLHEWHHVLAFIREPTPPSVREWRESPYYTEDDEQLERQIRSISKGLIEVRKPRESQDDGLEATSLHAGAGSLDFDHGETRVVQVIHESVRQYFLYGNGFESLDPSLKWKTGDHAHVSIMLTCLDYIMIKELDHLVHARTIAEQSTMDNLAATNQEIQTGQSAKWPSVFSHASSSAQSEGHGERGNEHELDPVSLAVGRNPSLLKSTEEVALQRLIQDESLPESHLMAVRGDENEGASKQTAFEGLRKLVIETSATEPGPNTRANVMQWIDKSKYTASYISLDTLAPPRSITGISATGRSQVLEDYPALLTYATLELFVHAREISVRPWLVVERFKQPGVWSRWRVLREGVSRETTFEQYASDNGLIWEFDYGTTDTSSERNPEAPPRQARRQARSVDSVESFNSAASLQYSASSYWL